MRTILFVSFAFAAFALPAAVYAEGVTYVGTSNNIATDGTAPGAITPTALTQPGDLLVFYHYSRGTGGDETVTVPTGFTEVFNSNTTNRGLVAVAYRFRQVGDTTYTASVTNHTIGTSGETILEWIETYSGASTTAPIANFTASLSNWTSSTSLGSVSAPASATVRGGDLAVVFAGRFENVTAQTTLSGDGLEWYSGVLNNTSNGSDAGAVTQRGQNFTPYDTTVTAKTITTTGTAQAGAGRMFVIQAAELIQPGTVIYTGSSNNIATDGTAPGAITPHGTTRTGDLLVFYHYSRGTGGNETVTVPTGFTEVFNSVTASRGLVAVGYRFRQGGDTTYTASVTNHTTGTSGETILEWIETYRNVHASAPITDFTSSLSTWTTSTSLGPVSAPAAGRLDEGDVAVVFAGRFENITGQTVLSGDGLDWFLGTRNDTSSGSDAAAVTQRGYANDGDATATAKTITSTGTTQAGAGRMFIIESSTTATGPIRRSMRLFEGYSIRLRAGKIILYQQ